MKLYRIKTLHAAPKDIHHSIMGYVIAEDDKAVMKYIDENYCYDKWADAIKDEQTVTEYPDDDFDNPVEISYENWILKHKGDLEDDDWSDAFYGITKFGWEEVTVPNYPDNGNFFDDLVVSGIAIKI
jgi:hypothetical protein